MIYQILFNYESPLQGNGQISKICECKKIADERTVQKKKEKKKERKKWNCRELNAREGILYPDWLASYGSGTASATRLRIVYVYT